MNKEEEKIKQIIGIGLEKEEISITFEKTWRAYEQVKKPRKILKPRKWVALVAAVTCLAIGGVISANYMLRQDQVEYPFRQDKEVIGVWRTIDFVTTKGDFKPGEKYWGEELYLKQITFEEKGRLQTIVNDGGKMYTFESEMLIWTKGKILDSNNMTDSAYSIESIDGKDYMFYQWKSGDYTMGGMEPYYYVLERITNPSEVVSIVNLGKVDDVNRPFVTNEAMIGVWESIDLVNQMSSFVPGEHYGNELFLRGLKFEEEGKVAIKCELDESFQPSNMTWTDDVVLNKSDQTASKCTIKMIDNQEYMFYEWKSGDYTIRGLEPMYYVLKRVE